MNIVDSYKQDLKLLRRQHKELADKRRIIKDKISGAYLEDNRTEEERRDQRIIAEMISSTTYALNWLKAGNEPPYRNPARQSLPRSRRDQLWADMDALIQWKGYKETTKDAWDKYEKTQSSDKKTEERLLQVKEVVSTLSPKEQELFHLRYAAMMSEKECAEEMGLQLGTIKSMAQRTRDKIDHYFRYGHQMDLFEIENLVTQ